MKKQAGFTLIELVAVMVILAILAVVAVPQFVDLRVNAMNSSAAGVGGALASGTALNYANGVANGAGASVVTDCNATQLDDLIGAPGAGTNATTLVLNGRTYTIGGAAAAMASGDQRTCTILDAEGLTGLVAQEFTIVGCATAACG